MPTNSKEYNRAYYAKNREVIYEKKKEHLIEYGKKWRGQNKDRMKITTQKYRKTPKSIKCAKLNAWKQHGIECNSEWDEVYEWYSSTTNCYICDKLFVESKDKCLDHDHELQRYNIRGILCRKCNNHYNEI